MGIVIALLLIALVLAIYVVWGRPYLRTKEWAQGYFKMIEPIEILLFSKSESILWARFLQLAGVLATALQFLGTVDVTPFISLIPEEYRPMLFLLITVSGFIAEWLRKDTTKPLEVVALPQEVPIEVAAAVQRADDANKTAVAVVEAEKAEGKV